MTFPATSVLNDIITKVRRLTASPSANQLTDQTICDYINTFYLYDFPENLQTLTLKTVYNFYTTPFVDAYPFPREQYRDIVPPIYIAGSQSFYSQSREQFYMVFPQIEFIQRNIATGTGAAGPYNFTLTNTPVQRGYTYPTTVEVITPAPGGPGGASNLQSRVLISAVDATGAAIVARDDGIGGFVDQVGNILVGNINYVTGAITNLNFGVVVPAGNAISASYISTVASVPTGMLFYGDMMFLRPIPDNVYHVQMDVYMFPSQLLSNATDQPQLREWWQYLAYGAAIKILVDRQDMGSVQNIMPFFLEQQRLVNRRNIVQNTNERSSTIYSEMVNYPYGNGFYRF